MLAPNSPWTYSIGLLRIIIGVYLFQRETKLLKILKSYNARLTIRRCSSNFKDLAIASSLPFDHQKVYWDRVLGVLSSGVYDLSPKGAAIQEVILRFRLSEFATVVSFLNSHFFEEKSQGTLSSYQLFFFCFPRDWLFLPFNWCSGGGRCCKGHYMVHTSYIFCKSCFGC